MDETEEETFPGGILSLVPIWERRRAPFVFQPDQELPPEDVDFGPLKTRLVPPPPDAAPDAVFNRYGQRLREAQQEFAGKPELLLVNMLLIMNLRKESAPPRAARLFRRLWADEAGFLIDNLSGRWLISSIITFADHGETEADRRIGQSLNIMFSLMKLYEAERLYSGHRPFEFFDPRDRVNGPLPMGMEGFALKHGDLEANFLSPLLVEAANAPVAGPLALALLDRLNRDPRSIFRRFALMRKAKRGKKTV